MSPGGFSFLTAAPGAAIERGVCPEGTRSTDEATHKSRATLVELKCHWGMAAKHARKELGVLFWRMPVGSVKPRRLGERRPGLHALG